jgi:pimeloyl-ACP methyl ester carboxylesterase
MSDPIAGGGATPHHESGDPDDPGFVYDEFALFHENCAEHDLPWNGSAEVERLHFESTGGALLSALRWGGRGDEVEVVLLHGSAQNAHTWDTVALALRPMGILAIDLPGHGRSEWRDDSTYDPHTNAEVIVEFIEAVAEAPVLLVGMSLGGLTANRVAAMRADLVEALVVVDITPGVSIDKAKDIHDFIAGPQSFPGFEEIFERTVMFNPTRSASSLRRGILHNAHRLPDGTWEWNYDRRLPSVQSFPSSEELWADIEATTVPYMLVRAADSPIVDDEDEAELLRRRPDADVVEVHDAGHSVQGDQPLLLQELLQRHRGR